MGRLTFFPDRGKRLRKRMGEVDRMIGSGCAGVRGYGRGLQVQGRDGRGGWGGGKLRKKMVKRTKGKGRR